LIDSVVFKRQKTGLNGSVGHCPFKFLTRTFPHNRNHKPNPNFNPSLNTSPTNPNPTDPTLTLILLTPLLTLTLIE